MSTMRVSYWNTMTKFFTCQTELSIFKKLEYHKCTLNIVLNIRPFKVLCIRNTEFLNKTTCRVSKGNGQNSYRVIIFVLQPKSRACSFAHWPLTGHPLRLTSVSHAENTQLRKMLCLSPVSLEISHGLKRATLILSWLSVFLLNWNNLFLLENFPPPPSLSLSIPISSFFPPTEMIYGKMRKRRLRFSILCN